MSEEQTQLFPPNGFQILLSRFDSLDARMDSFEKRMDSFDARLACLEDAFDRRLVETRPIWETVLSRLDVIDKRLDGVETRLHGVAKRLDGVAKRLDLVETRLDAVGARLEKVENGIERLDLRVDRLEEEYRDLNRKVGVFVKDVVRFHDFREDTEERLRRLENPATN